jgi:hypothetical protein
MGRCRQPATRSALERLGCWRNHSLASANLRFAVMATASLVSPLPQGIIHTFWETL